MKDKKNFTWWCENSSFGSQPHFKTIDEVKANIQKEYQEALKDIENGYDPDSDYWPEDLPNEVIIGEIEDIDIDKLTETIFESSISSAQDFISDFAFGTDCEDEFDTTSKSDDKFKESIKEWIKGTYIYPRCIGHEIERFKLK